MIAQELTFLKAGGVFQRIARSLGEAFCNGLRLDEVERQLKEDLREAGLAFLEGFVEASGDGDQGAAVSGEGAVLTRSETPQTRRYLSIFGELSISRYVYSSGQKKLIEYSPLDAQLGLPAGEISYVLEDFQQRLCVQTPYGKSTEDLKAILGTGVVVGTAEHMTQEMGEFAKAYRLSALTDEGTPPPENEAEFLVVAGDGKGVVMRKTLAERLREEKQAASAEKQTPAADGPSEAAGSQQESASERSREDDSRDEDASGKGQRRAARKRRQRRQRTLARRQSKKKGSRKEGSATRKEETKKSRKQMAYVGAVYTIAPFVRTPAQILNETSRRERAKDRPHPQNKHVWGEMTQLVEGELIDGRSSLFLHLAVECHLRDPKHQKTLICVMDGEEPLWAAKEEWLDRAVEVLDFFHVLDHLWKIKRSLPKSCPADDFVDHHARMLLEGKVDYVVRNFGRFINEWKLRGKAKAEMQRGIGYFRRNRERMCYDEYLAKGYPIGSGVAEGTCRNLVKDRMELTGMRWERRGAQSMIHLRALYLNGEWKVFINYRIEKEQKQLYGKAAAYSTITDYAQAL
jgi:hypothetical protein